MTSIALEDLLSSKTVDSLKLSIEQFDSTANEKKKELQGMVGSEYHLFVKSAKDVANIREKSEIVIKRLHNLSTKKISISKSFEKLQHLTGCSSFQGKFLNKEELETSTWRLINVCDFDTATENIQRNLKQKKWFAALIRHDILRWLQMSSVWRRLDVSKLAAAFSVIFTLHESVSSTFMSQAYKNCFSLYCKSAHDQISQSVRSIRLTNEDIEKSFSEIVNLLHCIILTLYILFCKLYTVNGITAHGLIHKYSMDLLVGKNANMVVVEGFSSSENLKSCSNWLHIELCRVRQAFHKLLASINSAQVLSSLQHTVFSLCCHPELGDTIVDDHLSHSNESVAIIIGKLFPSSTVSLDFGVWDLSFKIPFMQQSERMVEISCNKILMKVTKLFAIYAAQFGFEITQFTVISTPANECIFSSAKIYFMANNISHYLFNCLLKLKTEISLPDKLSDQASEFLFTAFHQHSLKVTGTLLVFLRKILDAISKEIRKSNSLLKISNFILFIGRLSWLIRFDGMFSERFFSINKLHSYPRRLKVSVEQLFSAFEIADADGDGKLNSSEVLEAIQALSSEEYTYEFASINRNIRFCERISITNFTFEEFTLLFGLKFCGNVSVPLKFVACCADAISSTSWSLLPFPFPTIEICSQVLNNVYLNPQTASTGTQLVCSFPHSACTVALMQFFYNGSITLSESVLSFENFQLRVTNSAEIKSTFQTNGKSDEGFHQLSSLLHSELTKKLVDVLFSHMNDQAQNFLSNSNTLSKAIAENFASDFYFMTIVIEYLIVPKLPEHFQSQKKACKDIRSSLETFVDTLSIDLVHENATHYANNFELGAALLNPFATVCSSKDSNSSDFISYFAKNSYHVGHFEQLPLPLYDL